MEFFFLLFVGWIIYKILLASSSPAQEVSAKPAVQASVMGPFQVKATAERIKSEEHDFQAIKVEATGLVPVPRDGMSAMSVVHLYDITDGPRLPVLCVLDDWQEADTRVFETRTEMGKVPINSGFNRWVPMGVAIVDTLIPPHRGQRKFLVEVCVVPTDNSPKFTMGQIVSGVDRIVVKATATVSLTFSDAGYLDKAQEREEAEELTVKLAFAVAAADGDLAPAEGRVIREWGQKTVESYAESLQDDHKERINEAIRNTYTEAKNSSIEVDVVAERLCEVASMAERYEAIELCLDVMSADGHADPEELRELDYIKELLGIDPQRFRAMQDRRLTQVETIGVQGEGDLGALVGITDDMDEGAIRKHLANEYKKWNSRVTAGDAEVKQKAEKMILLIGEARKKYLV